MSELFLEQSEQVLADWDAERVRMHCLPMMSDLMRWRPPGGEIPIVRGVWVSASCGCAYWSGDEEPLHEWEFELLHDCHQQETS